MTNPLRQLVDAMRQHLATKRVLSLVLIALFFGLLLWGRLRLRNDVPRTVVANPPISSVHGDASPRR